MSTEDNPADDMQPTREEYEYDDATGKVGHVSEGFPPHVNQGINPPPALYEEHRTPTPNDLIAQAIGQGANVEVLQGLYNLQKQVRADEARREFDAAMARFKADPPRIVKETPGHNGKYANLGAVCSGIDAKIKGLGLSYRWETRPQDKGVTVECIVSHVGGHEIRDRLAAAPDGSGNKNAIQAVASTVSYLRRYTLLGAFGLPTYDDDGTGPPPKPHDPGAPPPKPADGPPAWENDFAASLDETDAFPVDVVNAYCASKRYIGFSQTWKDLDPRQARKIRNNWGAFVDAVRRHGLELEAAEQEGGE